MLKQQFKRARLFALAILATIVGAVALSLAQPALALGDPLGELQGGASGDGISCGTSATAIEPSPVGRPRAKSMTLRNASATAIFIGGASVDTTGGLSVCSSGCHYTNVFEFDGAKAWCRVASGSVTIYPVWSY